MSWKNAKWLALDTETTGLSKTDDRIVELAATWIHNGQIEARHGTIINPGIPIPAGATAIHGITDDDVAKAPAFEDVRLKVMDHLAKAPVLVGHNIGFDLDFLRAHCPPGDVDLATRNCLVIDTLTLVRHDDIGRWWKGKGRHRLTSVANRLKLPFPKAGAHRASADAIMSARVLWHYLDKMPDEAMDVESWLANTKAADADRRKEWEKKNELKQEEISA